MSDHSRHGWRRGYVLLLTILFVTTLLAGPLAPAVVAAGPKKHHASGQQNGQPGRERRDGVQAEIVGGHPVKQGDDTFMVYILIDAGKQKKQPVYIQCGGTLIDPTHVLTAAHCVDGNENAPQKFHLAIGRANIGSFKASKGWNVAEVFQHPDYNDPVPFANDVAVLRLAEPVPERLAQPIAIVGSGQTDYDGAGLPVAVAGWGQTAERGGGSAQLRAADLRISRDQICGKAYRGQFDADVMICASYRNRDSCYGDSGGPLIALHQIGTRTVKKPAKQERPGKRNHRKKRQTKQVPVYENVAQIGIVSWGRGCAEKGAPGVYTRLSDKGINSFITNALKQ